ncbi:MAG: hypothetical protein ACM31G_09740 [Flavobacteriales bacterium]
MNNFNKQKWHTIAAFILYMIPSLSANAKDLITTGKINPRDSTLTVRNIIVAGGTVNILDGYNAQERGKNDFNGNKLTNGRLFVIDGIQVNYSVGVTATVLTKYDSLPYSTALPAALRSSNLVIKQGDDVIRRISIAAINEAKSTDARWYELDGFALLQEDIVTSIEIEFPVGSDLAAGASNSGYVEVIFKGAETVVKR